MTGPFTDLRYNSGTSLDRTGKEILIEWIEQQLPIEFSDDLFSGLKKLTRKQLRELHRNVSQHPKGNHHGY